MSMQGRAPQQESKSWYAANMGNDSQGLIVDEKTGANIAVAYDRKHAPLLAAAPVMYEALKRIKVLMESGDIEGRDWVEYGHIINALAQAEGR